MPRIVALQLMCNCWCERPECKVQLCFPSSSRDGSVVLPSSGMYCGSTQQTCYKRMHCNALHMRSPSHWLGDAPKYKDSDTEATDS